VARAVAVQPASNEMLTQRIESAETAAIYQLSDTAHWWRWWQRKSPGSESNSNKGATTGKINMKMATINRPSLAAQAATEKKIYSIGDR